MRAVARARKLVLLAVAAVVVLAARAIQPLVGVRFGMLPTGRIGPLAVGPEIYLCEREARPHGRTVDLFYAEGLAVARGPGRSPEARTSNEQLLAMWRRAIPVHPFVRSLAAADRRLPGGAGEVRFPGERDVRGVLAGRPPHLRFTAEELDRAERDMRALGLPAGAPFVGFHARDPAYLAATYPEAPSWSYHDYRDSDIGTYLDAARALAARGIYAVRMGKVVERPLDVPDPMILDYATSRVRSDLLDVVLAARCRFFLGNDSGLLFLPVTFRRRVALANFTLLAFPPIWSTDDLFITKRVWSRGERRLLSFAEMTSLPSTSGEFAARDLEVIDNAPEEIRDLATEMNDRLDGTWQTTDEDDELQARFRSVLARGGASLGPNLSRVGAAFLRQNTSLLD